MAYSYVRIFNPLPKCHRNLSLHAAHKSNENKKKWNYDLIIDVEHGSFTPFVVTCTVECHENARMLQKKRKLLIVSARLKTTLNFSLKLIIIMQILIELTSAYAQNQVARETSKPKQK